MRKCSDVSTKNLTSIGFTLLELMVVVMIVAILAAIAIPSYKRYFISNAESTVKEKMLDIALQAKRYRAKKLNFKGFSPINGYKDTAKKEFCAPSNSSCKYKVTMTDQSGKSLTDSTSNGSSWRMFGVPHYSSLENDKATKFLLLSDGTSCLVEAADTDYSSVTASTRCTGKKGWD